MILWYSRHIQWFSSFTSIVFLVKEGKKDINLQKTIMFVLNQAYGNGVNCSFTNCIPIYELGGGVFKTVLCNKYY